MTDNEKKLLFLFGLLGVAYYYRQPIVAKVGEIMSGWNSESAKKKALPYNGAFQAAENRYGLPPGLLSRIAWQESRYNPNAQSPVGAIGLMQFMPATAADYDIDPYNPLESIDGAGRFFRDLAGEFASYAPNHWPLVLASYNWGSGRVRKWLNGAITNWPAETTEYVQSVTRDLNLPVGPRVAGLLVKGGNVA